MGNVVGNLTQGELLQVFGRLLIKIGQEAEAGKYKDGIQANEYLDLISSLAGDAWNEYMDED